MESITFANILTTDKAIITKLDQTLEYQTFKMLHSLLNFGVKGSRPTSRDLLLNFAPLYIYRMAEDTNFKFGA